LALDRENFTLFPIFQTAAGYTVYPLKTELCTLQLYQPSTSYPSHRYSV